MECDGSTSLWIDMLSGSAHPKRCQATPSPKSHSAALTFSFSAAGGPNGHKPRVRPITRSAADTHVPNDNRPTAPLEAVVRTRIATTNSGNNLSYRDVRLRQHQHGRKRSRDARTIFALRLW